MSAQLNFEDRLSILGLVSLKAHWKELLKEAGKKQPSYQRFLEDIVYWEYDFRRERMRLARLRRAQIPEILVMETFPFKEQPRLKKREVLEIYDSMSFVTQPQELVFIGPTGCGKTGLGTAFLVHAINKGYRGFFTDCGRLVRRLRQSMGDLTEEKLLKRLESYDVLLIDEFGQDPLNKDQAGLLFELMKRRHKKRTTIITTQHGFEEWGGFIQNQHLTAALLDRITVNCAIFNMQSCISIRPKRIFYGTTGPVTGAKKQLPDE